MEIFSSVQGEGPHVGASTLFVRFGECDLRCRWCDSPHTWRPAKRCRVETGRGSGRVRELDNPVALDAVLAAAEALGLAEHRFASLTGGEPLLQPEAVAWLGTALRSRGPRVLLETHGLAVEALERVIDAVDVVSMDWKLGSDVRRAGQPSHAPPEAFHARHERFLTVARRAPEVVIKVVVTVRSEPAELDEMAERIARTDPGLTLVVQPVTPQGPGDEPPDAEQLLRLQARLERRLRDVRVIPQTHKALGLP